MKCDKTRITCFEGRLKLINTPVVNSVYE